MSATPVKPTETPTKESQPQAQPQNTHHERRVAIPLRVPDGDTKHVRTHRVLPPDVQGPGKRRIPPSR